MQEGKKYGRQAERAHDFSGSAINSVPREGKRCKRYQLSFLVNDA
jgi:hypothetical protein